MAIVVLGGAYYVTKNTNPKPFEVMCTEEAKICPDGSAVGRSGLKCEFAACPDVGSSTSNIIDTSDWKTYKNDKYGFELKYPSEWTNGATTENSIYFPLSPDRISDVLVDVGPIMIPPNRVVSLDQYLKEYGYNQIEKENKQIDNLPALRFEKTTLNSQDATTTSVVYILVKDKMIYHFTLNSTNQNDVSIFDQFLSTFKFTK